MQAQPEELDDYDRWAQEKYGRFYHELTIEERGGYSLRMTEEELAELEADTLNYKPENPTWFLATEDEPPPKS